MRKQSIWLWIAGLSFLTLAFSHFVLQEYLMMRPCEKCVYIRFAVLLCALVALVRLMIPSQWNALGLGVDATFLLGCGYGIVNAVSLLNAESNQVCALNGGGVQFPFGFPLHEWLPSLFAPTGVCGESVPVLVGGEVLDCIQTYLIGEYLQAGGWYLIPSIKFGSVAGCSLFFFVVMASAVVLFNISSFRRNK